ncbi:RTX toxin [Vibrio astriarenae]
MDVVFFVEVDGVVWKVLENGAWVQVNNSEVLSPDIPVLNATVVQVDGQTNPTENQDAEGEQTDEQAANDIPEELAQLFQNSLATSPYANNTNSLDNASTSSSGLILTGYVRPDLTETLAQAGFQTRGTFSDDNDDAPEYVDNTFLLSSSSAITVEILDGGDGYENRFEVPSATILGTAADVRDGIPIQVTVTDINGNQVVLATVAENNQYRIDNVDLTGLAEGELIVTATVSDVTGNSISANDQTIKDTLADIQGGLDGFGDAAINQVEQSQDRLFGTVNNVEDGQAITILVQDILGNQIQLESTVNGNVWVIRDVDLSDLVDGVLTVYTETIDVAGNPAVDVSTIVKDTYAQITIRIDDGDGQVDLFEAPSMRLFGTVDGIEDGQPVEITVTDEAGNTLTYNTVVLNQAWEITGADFTGFVDGPLSATVSSIDSVGNTASAVDTSQIVLDGEITVDILDGGDGYENQFEVPAVTIEGTTSLIPDGATINITITDINGSAVITSAIANKGVYSVSNVDISSLAEGDLSVRAEVGGAFKVIEAFDDTIKDTLAAVTGELDGLGDSYINFVEQTDVTVFGTVNNIEDGQAISVVISDEQGGEITLETTVSGSVWQLSNVDLSALADGTLTTIVSSTDVAGNPAVNQTEIIKDTQAFISVDIDDGGDDVLNISERNDVRVFGAVSNIEDGQAVEVTLTDSEGSTLTFNTTVVDGQWEISGIDLSGFAEGDITANASSSDIAGNEATAVSDASTIDLSLPTIDIDTLTGFDIFYFRDGSLTSIQGTTTGVDEGLPVTVLISDGVNEFEFSGNVDALGAWSLTDLDVSGLNSSLTWTMTASVANAIGNVVADDMPTLVFPDSVVLSENFVGIFGEDYAKSSINIENAEFTFDDTQDALLRLESSGQALSFTLPADKKEMVVTRSGGEVVLEAKIIDGEVDITLFQGLDNGRPGDLQTEIVIRGTQTDSDGTIEEVLAPVIVAVQDSRPLALDDSYTVTEGHLATGNLLSNDADLDGGLEIRNVLIGSDSQSVSKGNPAVFNIDEGRLFVFANGQWLLETSRNLDHQELQSIDLTYIAGDASVDYDSANAIITIVDGDTGTIFDNETLIVESDLTRDAVINSETIEINGGSDNPDPDTIRFDESSLATLDSLGLTSGISYIQLDYLLSADGKTITGSVSGTAILTISISAIASGNDVVATTEITLHSPLNESASNDIIYLPLKVIGEDTDGTPLESGEFVWQIQDGVDPLVTEGTSVSISEDELGAQAEIKSGTFNLAIGSDPIRSAYFDLSDFPSLTSEGRDVVYTISPDGSLVTAYQDDVRGEVVFLLYFDQPDGSIDEEITYYFAMDKPLDQDGIADTLSFPITVSDTDGDITKLDLKVEVTDASSGSLTADDMGVSERPVDPDNSGITDVDVATVTVNASKEPIVDIVLDVTNGQVVKDANGNEISHNGEPVYWSDNGDGSYTGQLADGSVIFVVTLPDDLIVDSGDSDTVDIQFQLREQFDHDQAGQDEQLTIELPISAIDTDGTRQSGSSNVIVYDGKVPSISVNGDINVKEDGLLSDGEEAGSEQSPPTITLDSGSDDFREYVLDVDAFNSLLIKSGTELVTLADKNGDDWYIASNESGDEVFRIRLLESGNVEFELSKPIAHDAPGSVDADGLPIDITDKPLEFKVVAKDFDNDLSDYQSIFVNVTDDVPVSRESTIELVEGDDVTDNLLTEQYTGADGATIQGVIYNGTEYDIDDFVDGKLTLNLFYTPDSTQVKYGELVIDTDGTFSLTTNEFVDNEVALTDSVEYIVVDTDGDTVKSIANLILDDAKGVLRTPDRETREDESAELSITVILGDLDQGEVVESITISEASLNGGTLYLDGVELSAVGGFVTLSGTQLQSLVNDVYIPNGTLTYLPAENQSNTTTSISLEITATIRNADLSAKTLSNTLNVSVLPVADAPEWADDARFEYDTIEDAADVVELELSASLVDVDTSEDLSFEISNIPDGITLYLNGNIVKEGMSYSQTQLDKMTVVVDDNLAGVFEFNITAVATEQGNNFAQPADETASITHTVTINVSPDADKPELSVRNIDGLEDTFIPLNEAIKGNLTDTDGSESLFYEIVVPDGWSIQGTIVSQSGNTYLVEASDVESGEVKLISKADISSVTESLSIDVTAVSKESTIDGLTPITEEARSETKTITIDLKGVIDEPVVIDGGNGHWQFDDNAGDKDGEISAITPFNEDSLITLDFLVNTKDDDGSEVINILLTGLPNEIRLVDSEGNPISLTIAEVDPVTGPIFQFDNQLLSETYIKTPQDFSGRLELIVRAITTEPDGDTGSFDYDLKVDVAPVVDQSDDQVISTVGIEDRSIALDLNLSINEDIDGSESLIAYYIDGVSDGITLFFDDVAQEIPGGGLNLADLLDSESPTLDALLTSGRITVKADRDLSGDFDVQLRYTVEDTSETGVTTTKELNGTANVVVEGRVEFDTRLEATTRLLESTDGSPIDLSNAAWFVEEDVDGSELLDYIVLEIPDGANLIVEHPNGAAQNASGDWIISAEGLTSDSVRDTMAMILKDATIRSPQNTDIITIGVKARVLDDPDADFISTQFDIRITGHDGGGGSCGDVGEPGDITDGSDIQFDEGETIDLSGLLNSDVADDPDNTLSFYVPSDSLPEGVYLEGDGIIVEYNDDGTVAGYSVSPSALSTLTLYGVDEDFAGCIEFNIVTVETSTCNGTSNETDNTIKLEILPVVDDFSVIVGNSVIQEDTTTAINLELVLGDSIEDGQTISGEGNEATGKESVLSMVITVPDGVVLSDISGDSSYIQDNGDNTYTIKDESRLADLALTPPAHFSGELTISVTTEIIDEATCVDETDTQTKTSEFTITIEPVADQANLTVETVSGDEDSYISLGALQAELIDQDGSENMSLCITGVPTDAVLVIKIGEEYQLLPNNGADGGSFGGNPTYEWQVTVDQLPDVYLLPPLDYSGDIPLALEAITQEIGTTDIRYTTGNFTVGVNPIGDDVQFFDVPSHVNGNENDAIEIATNLISEETDSDEYIQLTVIAEADSEPSALVGLNRIRAGGNEAKFTQNDDGTWSATLTVTAATLSSFELFAGDAYGELNLRLQANAVDQQIVLGSRASDQGDVTSASVVVNITPEPDQPELKLNYDSIIAEAAGTIPLGLTMAMINPVANDEVGELIITGLPDNLILTHGTREGSVYTVPVEDVENLAIEEGYSGAQSFTLALEAQSTLGGETATAPFETLSVTLEAVGETEFNATSGNDIFVFQTDGVGSADTPTIDTIIDFDYAKHTDVIDLTEIFTNLNITIADGASAEQYLTLDEQGGNVELLINTDKADDPNADVVNQKIVLEDVSLEQLYGTGADAASQAELLQKMIDDNNLNVPMG